VTDFEFAGRRRLAGPAFAQRMHRRFAGLKADALPIPKRRATRLAPAPIA